MLKLLILLALTGTTSCGTLELDGTPVPSRYAYLFESGIFPEDEPAVRASLPYDRIELEDSGVWYTPGYSLTLWRDGKAEGSYGSGEVTLWDFGSLCYLIEKLQFASMRSDYRAKGTDAGTTVVRVWASGLATPISVSDYGGVGPIELWGIQTAIDGVAGRIEWKESAK